jgi:hypothetical protein
LGPQGRGDEPSVLTDAFGLAPASLGPPPFRFAAAGDVE